MSVTINRPGALDSAGLDAGSSSPAGPVQLSDILITAELSRRRPRRPDYAAENRALVALAREMSEHPRSLPQKLVEVAVRLCEAGSAGISLLRGEGSAEHFVWEAMAGVYAPHVGGTTPRNFSPCGVTLDQGAPQLFFYPGRYFEYFQAVEPSIVEGLIIPFHAGGRPLGTIWIVSHDETRGFDAEDQRIMTSLAEFTGAALQTLSSLDAMTAAHAELERAREVLQESDRRKDEFLATLAHELRNPLAPVRNSLHLLRAQGGDGAVHDHALEVIDRQVEHLVRLVDDLLEVSRITRGKLELRKERIELTPVLLSAVETSRPLIEAAGHELTIRLPDQPIVLEGDPVRLAQLLSNLLNNAAKYTEPGGRISLSALREGDEAVIQVQDSGIGIAPDMLSRVFEMFTQADGSKRRSHGGLGIGLALVRTLVQMHGGRVEADSPGPSQGSTFTVRLPILDGQRDSVGRDDDRCAEVPAWPVRRILVVDDNRDSAESMGCLLECKGSEVEVAHDGPSALQAIDSYQPAVVLLDIGMPGMDGYEVARRVRERRDLDHVTLIAVTGWGQEEDQRRSREAGFDHHLVKPVDLEVLRALLAVSGGQTPG